MSKYRVTGYRLEPATREHVGQMARIDRELFPSGPWTEAMFAEELGGPGRQYTVILNGSAVCGYGGLWFDGDSAHIMTIAVDEPTQGYGLGRWLLHTLLDQARELGAEDVLLDVRVDNNPAIELYHSAGFGTIGMRARYYPDGSDALTMHLDLSPALEVRLAPSAASAADLTDSEAKTPSESER